MTFFKIPTAEERLAKIEGEIEAFCSKYGFEPAELTACLSSSRSITMTCADFAKVNRLLISHSNVLEELREQA